jgi:hypothetical protein
MIFGSPDWTTTSPIGAVRARPPTVGLIVER